MRLKKSDWQDVEKIIGMFGKRRNRALKKYEEFIGKGVDEGPKT